MGYLVKTFASVSNDEKNLNAIVISLLIDVDVGLRSLGRVTFVALIRHVKYTVLPIKANVRHERIRRPHAPACDGGANCAVVMTVRQWSFSKLLMKVGP